MAAGLHHVRLSPKSGHQLSVVGMSGKCHEQTFDRLFDHLVSGGDQRNGQTERFDGLEIDRRAVVQIWRARLFSKHWMIGAAPSTNFVPVICSYILIYRFDISSEALPDRANTQPLFIISPPPK